MQEMKRTVLFPLHEKMAKMAPYAGYLMPLQYGKVEDEVYAVRHQVGLFDISHMGFFIIQGDVNRINYLFTNDLSALPLGKSSYNFLLKKDGTIVDDLIVYRLAENKFLVCVNASNKERDLQLCQQLLGEHGTITSYYDSYSILAIQGPQSGQVISKFFAVTLDRLTIQEIDDIYIARTGYTGEDGYECFIPNHRVTDYYQRMLLETTPCALVARDILRLEAALPLYGHELSEEVTPFDTPFTWAVKMHKDFQGRDALANYVVRYQLINFTLSDAIPRASYKIWQGEQEVGEVTSGVWSFTLQKGVAMARVRKDINLDNLFVKIRNNMYPLEIVKGSFIGRRT